jgi:Initiator Replication protein
MQVSSDAIVLKPTGTVQITNRFSLVERKLLNTLMYYAQQRRFSPQEHSLPVADVFFHIGLGSSRNHDVIKDALKKLIGTIIEWNIFGDDKVQEWGVCTFLASGKLARGKIRFRINPEIVDQITHPQLFAKIQLLIQAQFKRRHALVLYEFLIDCICRQKATRLVIKEVPLGKLFQLMGLQDSKYADPGNFKIFNRDIIKPSIEDLNQHSDLSVKIKPVRQGRRVMTLDFAVERNTSFQVLLDFKDSEVLSEDVVDSKDIKSNSSTGSSTAELIDSLIQFGVGQHVARDIAQKYPAQQIQRNMEFIYHKVKDGKDIKNIGAYLVRAIEDNYAGVTQRQLLSANLRGKRDAEKLHLLRDEWDIYRRQRANELFQTLSEQEKKYHRQAFIVSGVMTSSYIVAFEKHGGWDNPLVEHAFTELYLVKKLLKAPEETSLDAYRDWKLSCSPIDIENHEDGGRQGVLLNRQ